ncbi:MAG TPA: hypothetical protein ENI23_10125 [bacterium]|nr:hypothetical protein [bacterium]
MQLKKKKLALFVIIATFPLLSGCFGGKVAPEPVPNAPSNLTATANSSTQVELSWQDNSNNEERFYLYRKSVTSSAVSSNLVNSDYSQIGYVGANSNGAYDTEASPGTTYWYKVTAGNDSGESDFSNEASVTTPGEATAPSAPSNLTGQAISSSEINLTWQDNSSNEMGFYIYRKTTDDYSIIATMEANATSYNNTNLNPETAYSYKIIAYNDIGESESSNAINVTTPAEPLEPPSNPMAEAVTYKQINLTWQDNSDDEDHFRINSDFGLGPGNNQFLVNVPANTTHYEDCNLQPMREYKYFVMAERNGERAVSERFSATTPCPVTAMYEMVWPISYTLVSIDVGLKSEADEVCRVKAIVSITDYWGEVLGSIEETFEGVVPGDWWNSGNWWVLEVPIVGDSIKFYATIEITDVEIEY